MEPSTKFKTLYEPVRTHSVLFECAISVSVLLDVTVHDQHIMLTFFNTARPLYLCFYAVEQGLECTSICKNVSLSKKVFLQAVSDCFLEKMQFISCFC